MADHARIGTPEVKVGLFPMTIVPPMMRVLPRRRLMEMFITGVPLTAEEALQFNLVNYVTDAAGWTTRLENWLPRLPRSRRARSGWENTPVTRWRI